MPAFQTPIVFIGPMAAGKTTLAKGLSRRLELRYVPLDVLRYYYYAQQGMDFLEMFDRPSFAEMVEFWLPYHLGAVRRVLDEFPDGVIDFGAGHAHFTDPERRAELLALLGPNPNVFLVLPSADLDRAEEICVTRDRERLGAQWDEARDPVGRAFVRSESFREVAKHTIVTEDRTVEACLEQIVGVLR